MKKELRVKSVIIPDEYRTMADSVAAVAEVHNTNRAKLESLKGSCVVNYQFGGDRLSISFSNDCYLTVFPGDNSIKWDVVSDKPVFSSTFKIQEDIYIAFSSDVRRLWNWKERLDSLIGKEVNFSPSTQNLFFSVKGESIEYIIDMITDQNDKQRLYISET